MAFRVLKFLNSKTSIDSIRIRYSWLARFSSFLDITYRYVRGRLLSYHPEPLDPHVVPRKGSYSPCTRASRWRRTR